MKCFSHSVRHAASFSFFPSLSASVSETASIGWSVIKVRATDQDMGPNAEMTYKITRGDDPSKSLELRFILE